MQAAALVGEYAVEGKNEDGDFYAGKATISSKGPGRYLVSWDLGEEDLLIHDAYVVGSNLHVDFYAADYAIHDDGTLEGSGGGGRSYERLTPYRLVHIHAPGATAQVALAATAPAGTIFRVLSLT